LIGIIKISDACGCFCMHLGASGVILNHKWVGGLKECS
jgi:hypothetical protein